MKYEKAPITALIKRKSVAKLTTDMSKLSSLNILRYLYKRHDTSVWIFACAMSWALIIWIKLG